MESRSSIAARVRDLRRQRRWTQAELARRLELSQPRLSQIERGDGSFTAEQFLEILELFNVGVEHFAPSRASDATAVLQSALARHGAAHLAPTGAIVPSELESPTALVAAVLRNPESPRHVAALAPVLVARANQIDLAEVASQLARLGRERRVAWLAESVRAALEADAPAALSDRRHAQRAKMLLDLFLGSAGIPLPTDTAPLDVLDVDVRSLKSAEPIFASASAPARRWRIVTRLSSDDFLEALRGRTREAR
ncbi:MAG: helix-turn-helix transcriptional regulator [Polyangiales bacterium]